MWNESNQNVIQMFENGAHVGGFCFCHASRQTFWLLRMLFRVETGGLVDVESPMCRDVSWRVSGTGDAYQSLVRALGGWVRVLMQHRNKTITTFLLPKESLDLKGRHYHGPIKKIKTYPKSHRPWLGKIYKSSTLKPKYQSTSTWMQHHLSL